MSLLVHNDSSANLQDSRYTLIQRGHVSKPSTCLISSELIWLICYCML